MRSVVPLLGVVVLAGCANPYMIPPPSRVVFVPAQPYNLPRYEPPPAVFRPNLPPPIEEARPLDPEPEPAAVDPGPTEPPPVATIEPPPPTQAPNQASTPVAIQKSAPETGSAVPLMGFRPMKGQKAPGA